MMQHWTESWRGLMSTMGQWPLEQWLQLATAVGVLLAAAVAHRQLSLLRRQLRDNQLKARRDRTLRYSLVSSPELGAARAAVDHHLPTQAGRAKPLAEIQAALAADENLRRHLLALLGHWENLALTVAAGAADEDVAFEMVGSVLIDSVGRLEEYIRDCQTVRPRQYAYLLRLADRWRTRLAKEGAQLAFSP